MKRSLSLLLCLVLLMMCVGCDKVEDIKESSGQETAVSPSAEPTQSPEPTEPVLDIENMTLKERYADNFKIGVALPNKVISNPVLMETVKEQFNSFTFENEMKPDALLDANACRSGYPKTVVEPVLNFSKIEKGMQWAVDNDFSVRGHTLVWHSQTPAWFFTEDYQPNSKLASREVMLMRMESYIKQVMTYCNENYPGVIYAWDVVNEAIDPSDKQENGYRTTNSYWYQIIGEDFVEYAFQYARKYAAEGAELYYNDYNCSTKITELKNMLQPLVDKGLIDGIGMQSHLDTSTNVANAIYYTAREFADMGLKVQITELDINQKNEQTGDDAQAIKYKVLFERMEEAQENGTIDINSITVWGLYDEISWRENSPLLYRLGTDGLEKKPAWYGAMQDPSIVAIEW